VNAGRRASVMVRALHRPVLLGVVGAALAFGLIQLVPYRVDNPPVRAEPAWDSPRTRALAVAACFDCHSNQTRSHWYTRVAPFSWWTTSHVRDGRATLNFSESTGRGEDDAAETVANGSMPPAYYTWLGLNRQARLSPADRQALIDGLRATLGNAAGGRGGD
jgi:mono/diheme cytochrome c family protein